MVSQKVVIKNPTGLHLRPAGILCKEAMKYKSHITFSHRDSVSNAVTVTSSAAVGALPVSVCVALILSPSANVTSAGTSAVHVPSGLTVATTLVPFGNSTSRVAPGTPSVPVMVFAPG